jgi:hypothetical protein
LHRDEDDRADNQRRRGIESGKSVTPVRPAGQTTLTYHGILGHSMKIVSYLQNLSNARLILWAYLMWYIIVAVRYFDPNYSIWLNALGIALFVGFSLYLNLLAGETKQGFWQIARCFLTPFCVSSFSALAKDKGFLLIFSPSLQLNLVGLAVVGVFTLIVFALRRRSTR